jgi:hypothetical protein
MKLIRPKEACARLGVGRTKFYKDLVAAGRLRLVYLGPRTSAVVERELELLIEELVRERDATPLEPRTPRRPRPKTAT